MKVARHNKILQIIKEYPITSQRQLVEALSEAGFKVTQATVSRDVRELGLVKVPAEAGMCYITPESRVKNPREEERLRRMVRDGVIGFDTSENLVVVKTFPGAAQGVASAVDQADWPGVIGTVAGDDTFLIILRSRGEAAEVGRRLKALSTGRSAE
ncbi:MAG TPA: arginine repressor [Desulfotomaculum sp.]|nr:arginine repressor [Desulfotomaculum sp.]